MRFLVCSLLLVLLAAVAVASLSAEEEKVAKRLMRGFFKHQLRRLANKKFNRRKQSVVEQEATELADTMYSTNTYAQAIQYARTHPTRDGGSWAGWCASLMVRSGDLPNSAVRPNAISAYRASRIASMDYNAAPSGAFHWWDIGADGHVAMATNQGWALMASSHVTESWGQAIGVISIAEYNRRTGARYLGWSYDYAGAEIADVRKRPGPSPPGPTPGGIPKTSTADDGIPGTNYYRRQQLFAQKVGGYTGPLDGSLGVSSWAGTQRALRSYGYTGPDDGVPGANTYKAIQRVAQQYGYTGPIDGELGANTYKGFAKFLNTL